MKVLAPEKYAFNDFTEELTLKEFARLFSTDSTSERVVKKIKEELDKIYKE